MRLAVLIVVCGLVWAWQTYGPQAGVEPPQGRQPPAAPSATSKPTAATKPTAPRPAVPSSATATSKASPLLIRDVVLHDQDGREIYRGDVDLRPTIERIRAGRKLKFPNDGSTFQNRERRLPQESSGYYREWVVPTPGESGPGPQRLVTGKEGEVWYTHDHYRSFRRIE